MRNEAGRFDLGGIDLGHSAQALRSAVQQIEDYGLNVDVATIYELRSGSTSGTELELWIECKKKQAKNDASAKNRTYAEMAKTILALRRRSKYPPYRYITQGLTESAAKSSKMLPRDFRFGLNCMRADFLSAISIVDRIAVQDVMSDFFRTHRRGSSSKVWRALESSWDGTPEDLYRYFTEKKVHIGPLVADEAAYLGPHFVRRSKHRHQPLSPFDCQTLELIRVKEPAEPHDEETDDGDQKAQKVINTLDEDAAAQLIKDSQVVLNREMILTHLKAIKGDITHKMK